MSFSSVVKKELSKVNSLANKRNVLMELLGYLITVNVSILQEKRKRKIRFSTESEYNINRFAKLCNNLAISDYQIEMQGKNYVITFPIISFAEIVITEDNKFLFLEKEIPNIETEEKSFVRGCFLGSGSINNPENNYHMEIIFRLKENAVVVLNILKRYHIDFKILEKENHISIYTKDGEEISKFLAFIGANSSVLKYEDIRVYRDMRNNVNRLVNCETANLNKTVSAAVKQVEAIEIIKQKGKFSELTDPLKEIANLRLQNPEASLIELGQMLKSPVGKSGVNYRLKTLIKIAETLK